MHLAFIRTRGQAGLDAPSVTAEIHLSAGTMFIVVGSGERNITSIYDSRQFPRVDLKSRMGPALQC